MFLFMLLTWMMYQDKIYHIFYPSQKFVCFKSKWHLARHSIDNPIPLDPQQMILNKHWKTPENHTTILALFTVEVELWCSTIGGVQITISYDELHFLQWMSMTKFLLQASHCVPFITRQFLHTLDCIGKAQFENVYWHTCVFGNPLDCASAT